MIAAVIRWSLDNRFLVLLITAILVAGGIFAVARTPLDAIPDLSDVQVIIKTTYPGQAPQIVEDQVTYPLATAMLSVPGAVTVRGYSMFGDSFVYIIFEDGTDIYWARSRVLEFLNSAASRLPAGVTPTMGPDATGVGWVYQYAVMSKELNLTEDQKTKIQPIMEDMTKQMQAVRSDTSLSQQDRMAKARAIHDNAKKQVEPILTAEQREKFEKMQQAHHDHMGARRRGNKGAAPQPTPQPQQ